MKVELELNIVNSRLAYLNFWDASHGKDVVGQEKLNKWEKRVK